MEIFDFMKKRRAQARDKFEETRAELQEAQSRFDIARAELETLEEMCDQIPENEADPNADE